MVKKNFSKYAHSYDSYSDIQAKCAHELNDRLNGSEFSNILDIGCGTGSYTKLLRDRFPKATIKAIDISEEMIGIAEKKLKNGNIAFITEDAEKIKLNDQFDLITSNASFQWFENLEKTIEKYKAMLKENGIMLFSMFGPGTFSELSESIKEVFGQEKGVASDRFLSKTKVYNILKKSFSKIETEEKTYKEKYDSLMDFLKKIKYSGIRGMGTGKKNLWSPRMLSQIEKVYREKFKGINVTYKVFFAKGDL